MSDHFRALGIHDNHNASVCLLEDGKVVFSLQEERLNGIKNFNGFPKEAIARSLGWAGISLDDIDIFAFGTIHNPAWRDTAALLRYYAEPAWKKDAINLFKDSPLFSLYASRRAKERRKYLEAAGIPAAKTRVYDHHLAHAAGAYYGSGFPDQSLVLTLDGGGDGACAGVYVAENGAIRPVSRTPEGHSIGDVYSYSTYYMGMTPLEHEYKLMGMAPYSQPKYFSKISAALDGLLAVDGLTFRRRTFSSTANYNHILGPVYRRQRFDAVCGALQDFTERLVLRWVNNAIAKTGLPSLCLSGGVFMNVKMNKLIAGLDGVEKLFIMPSCGDESNAMGATYLAHAEHCTSHGGPVANRPLADLYLGESFGEPEVKAEVARAGYSCVREDNIDAFVAEMLAEDRIVARCTGRSEWGARALGNRSILANPASFATVQKINDAIKMRDFWMPFAGSVTEQDAGRYLVNPKGIPSPYMMMAFDTTGERSSIQAATHPKDRTMRPQILKREHNPAYYRLIMEFAKRTGISCVLNTSFNLHGSPMVYHPRDALDTLGKSDLSILVMDNLVVRKDA